MKKFLIYLVALPLIFINFGVLTAQQNAPFGKGWRFYNDTDSPIAIAWYKTKIAGIFRTPWGQKVRLTAREVVNPQESRFIQAPDSPGKWDGYDTRRELLLTLNSDQLQQQIDADDSGVVRDERLRSSLLITDKHSLPSFYTEDDVKSLTLFLKKDFSSFGVKIEPEKKPSFLETFSPLSLFEVNSWILKNTQQKPVYYAWFEAEWNRQKGAYVNPQKMAGQKVIQLDIGYRGLVQLPLRQKTTSSQRQLLLSFSKESLLRGVLTDNNLNLLPNITAYSKNDLRLTKSGWGIIEDNNRPTLVEFINLIQVINTTNEPLYCSLFYVSLKPGQDAQKTALSRVEKIEPQLSTKIQYPEGRSGYDIQLLIARERDREILDQEIIGVRDLQKLTKKSFRETNLINWYLQGAYTILFDVAGRQPSQNFKIVSVGGGATERAARKLFDVSKIDTTFIEVLEQNFIDRSKGFIPDRAILTAARSGENLVKTENDRLTSEKDFVKGREETVRTAINELFNRTIIPKGGYVPKIALVFTGGGYRAMIETIGFLEGAKKAKIFNCSMYMTGLSGSTWAINPLVASGKNPTDFAQMQREKVTVGDYTGFRSLYALIQAVVGNPNYVEKRFIQSRYGQYHGPIGLYGHAIANTLMKDIAINGRGPHEITLSDLRDSLSDRNKYPLPISVAVDEGTSGESRDRLWFEFSPYSIGTQQEGGSGVDTKLFGCTFKNGKIVHYVPEYPLAQYMGIWGSAFALTANDITKSTAVGGFLAKTIESLSSGVSAAYNLALWKEPVPSACPGRTTAGQMPNYGYLSRLIGLPRLQNDTTLCLIDGGIVKETDFRHNFATVPALARDVDILIMCDSLEHPNTDPLSKHLLGAAQEALRLNYKFPNLTESRRFEAQLAGIQKEISTLFYEAGKPLVVYMKGKKLPNSDFDPDASVARFTSTDNFRYSPEQYDSLTGLAKNIISDETTIQNIKVAIERVLKNRAK